MVAGVEFSDLNWLGMGLAMLFAIVLGFIWYAPWTPMGRYWMRGQGLDPANLDKPPAGKMAQSMAIMLVGTFLTWFVIGHTAIAYQDSYTLDCQADESLAGCDGDHWNLTVMDGVYSGLFTWAGFFLPLTLGAVAWERKGWGYALNNAAYYLITLVVGGILVCTIGA